jgi:branched-chain amino acid transport system ATP-binding protein
VGRADRDAALTPVHLPVHLAVERVTAGYDAAVVLRDVSLEARPGEVVALVGGNGAGKTTLLRAIAGLTPIRAGAIRLDGARLDGLPPYRVAARGVALVPEGRRLFDELTVAEHLELGAWLPAARPAVAASTALVQRLFPALTDRWHTAAADLSGGEQQMVAIGRALVARPRLLVLDDPFLGLAAPVTAAVADVLRELAASRRATILAAGQHVRRLLRLADRGYLLEGGRVVAEAPGDRLLADPAVRRVLLGRDPAP